MAPLVRLLNWVQVVLVLLHFAISVFQEVSVSSFPVYIFPHGNSGGNGSPRACSSSCDWVCNKSLCACSLISSLRIVAGHIIKFLLSCDNDVGDVGEVEHGERVDKNLDNDEHEVLRIILSFAIFHETWLLTSGVQSVGFAEIQVKRLPSCPILHFTLAS